MERFGDRQIAQATGTLSRLLGLSTLALIVSCDGGGDIYRSGASPQTPGSEAPQPSAEAVPIIGAHRAVLSGDMELPQYWRYIGDSISDQKFFSAQFACERPGSPVSYFDVTLELITDAPTALQYARDRRKALRAASGDRGVDLQSIGEIAFFNGSKPGTVFFCRNNAFLTLRQDGGQGEIRELARLLDARIEGIMSGEIIVPDEGTTSVRELPAGHPPPGYPRF